MREPLLAIVVEDQYLLAETLVDVLHKLGCKVLASAASLNDAMKLATNSPCDFAVVDIDLNGEAAFPVLDVLSDRGIPFLLATGTSLDEIPPRHVAAIAVSKPYDMHEIRRALRRLAEACNLPQWAELQTGAQATLPRWR